MITSLAFAELTAGSHADDGVLTNAVSRASSGHRTWGFFIDGLSMNSFVARSDLPVPLPGVITVGRSPEIELAVTGARWKELVGRKGTRGFVAHPLGVVPDHDVVRCPELPTYEERLKERRS